jgi:parvulin-like peptidyl-prolyl isomerase
MSELPLISPEEVFFQVKLSGQLPAMREAVANRKITLEAAAKAELEVTLEEIQVSADQFRKANNLGRAEDTLAWLQHRELTLEDFESMIHFSVLSTKLVEHLFADKVEAYFAAHQLEHTAVALYETVLEDEDIALELFYCIREGEMTFFEVAQQYIQDPELRRRGGYRGILERTELTAEISAAVFTCTPPQLLKPILTAHGVHLIHIDEIFQPELNEKVRSKIISLLFTEWLKQEIEQIQSIKQ